MTDWFTNYHRKFDDFKAPTLAESLCCWTDLLGFGQPLFDANWEPSSETWLSTFKRIRDAHRECYQQLDVSAEFALTLNDGIVRCCNLSDLQHVQQISMWLRACILTHNRINQREKQQGLPGARTVIAHGRKLIHGPSDLNFEDFVLNYTKPDPSGPSSFPRSVAERVVASNPEPLQLNLAFSKAYILDSLGHNHGISGPHFYVDNSVIDAISRFSEAVHPGRAPLIQDEGPIRVFAVEKVGGQAFHVGFRLNLPHISVSHPRIVTNVYRASGFYPWDEPLPFVLPIE